MRVIVSCEKSIALEGYVVVNSYAELTNWHLEDIEYIILHSSSEDDTKTILHLSELHKSGVKTVAYICKAPSQIIKFCIQAVGGICVEDEFYLEDREDLECLLSDYDVETSQEKDSIEIIREFIQAFMNNDTQVLTPIFLNTVNNAVQVISDQSVLNTQQAQDVGLTAIDIFSNLSETLNKMKDSSEKIQKKFADLEAQFNQAGNQGKFGFQQVFLFPPYYYTGSASILNICEVSPCRFLTSFCLAYREYLAVNLGKRAKLLILHQKNRRSADKYRDRFAYIGVETAHDKSLLESDCLVTDIPKEDILKAIFRQNCDIIIIIDRMYNEPIMKGKVKSLYAINGNSDIKRYKLKQQSLIVSDAVNPTSEFINIPFINQFDTTGSSSASCYFQMCHNLFQKLDKFIDVEVD